MVVLFYFVLGGGSTINTNETVNISLTQVGGSSADLIGAVVTITDDDTSVTLFSAIYAGIPITTEIELGTNYTITVDSITGYYGTLSRSYIARYQNVNNVIFQFAQSGIYVLSTDGYFITAENWNTDREDAVGVAVIASNHAFVVSPNGYSTYISASYGTPCAGATAITNQATARQRFSGQSDTQLILQTYGTTSGIAGGYIDTYRFSNGKKGYIPSLGELNIILNNITNVNSCLTKINGDTIDSGNIFTTSTYYGLVGNAYTFWAHPTASTNYYRFINAGSYLIIIYSL